MIDLPKRKDERKFQILFIVVSIFAGALPFISLPDDPHTGRICAWALMAFDAYLAAALICMIWLFIVWVRIERRDRFHKFIEMIQKNRRRKRNEYYYKRRNKVQINCCKLGKKKICAAKTETCYYDGK